MKKSLFSVLIIALIGNFTHAQVINFTDPFFKDYLLLPADQNFAYNSSGESIQIDANNNGEIEESEAQEVSSLYISSATVENNEIITNIDEISYFTNLKELTVNDTHITNLDTSSNILLENLNCDYNTIQNMNLTGNINLIYLSFSSNFLSHLEISDLPAINSITGNYNLEMTSINISNCPVLGTLNLSNNDLQSIFVTECPLLFNFNFDANSNLEYVFIPDSSYLTVNIHYVAVVENSLYICCNIAVYQDFVDAYESLEVTNMPNIAVGEFCESFNKAYVRLNLDLDSNGCNENDEVLSQYSLNVSSTTEEREFSVNNVSAEGYATVSFVGDQVSFSPNLNSEYYTISPELYTIDFSTNVTDSLDFCVTPNGDFDDLIIDLIPINDPIPGFQSNYKIIYTNLGTVTKSGSISLDFDDNHLNYESALPAISNSEFNQLTWNYADLLPLESRTIEVNLLCNTPQDPNYPLNSDDILSFQAIIYPIESDLTPIDNISSLRQLVVNSLDPNDKIMLEGESITPEMVGKFVTYRIRFENTGTANAVNIVVEDIIDPSKFDISTLQVLDASHELRTIIEADTVQFKFNNIQLPFDDAHNDGYVFFKIKTLESLQLGDTFSNDADIYFDYNFPIVTNNFVTIIENLGVEDVENTESFSIYPNPAKDYFSIKSNGKQIAKVEIYSADGKLMSVQQSNNNQYDASRLNAGVYLLKIYTKDDKASTEKLIIQ